MPTWQPIWDDVRFDHERADAAVAELMATARLIDDHLGRRTTAVETARDGWAGRHRETFDRDFARVIGEGERLAASLRAAAGGLHLAAAAARADQARRVEDRARWEREAAAESEGLARTG